MKIKYIGPMGEVEKRLLEYNYCNRFKRHVWKIVPDVIGEILCKEQYFLSEQDILFDPKFLTMKGMDVALTRFGALGDLIMLLPVVRQLKKVSNHRYHLVTQRRFVEVFRPEVETFSSVHDQSATNKIKFDKTIFLDGVLETDHSLTSYSRLQHRVHLYAEFFRINIDSFDFSMHINDSDIELARRVIDANS